MTAMIDYYLDPLHLTILAVSLIPLLAGAVVLTRRKRASRKRP